jgi:parallel beta-helix repeat protein
MFFLKKLLVLIGVLCFLTCTSSAATLQVPAKYKTIQNAVNAAQDGDTIKVASGVYKETISFQWKDLIITGVNFPTLNGAIFSYGASGMLFGFKVIKDGAQSETGGVIIRNNQFVNCDVILGGQSCAGNVVLNNKFTNGGIGCYDSSYENSIIGNYIYGAKKGLIIKDSSVKSVTKNTFKSCGIAVQTSNGDLSSFIGNTYLGNKKKFVIAS